MQELPESDDFAGKRRGGLMYISSYNEELPRLQERPLMLCAVLGRRFISGIRISTLAVGIFIYGLIICAAPARRIRHAGKAILK